MCCRKELDFTGNCPGRFGYCWHDDLENVGATCTDYEEQDPTGTQYCPRSHPYAVADDGRGHGMCCTDWPNFETGECEAFLGYCWSVMGTSIGETCMDYADGQGCCRDQTGNRGTPTMNEVHGGDANEGVMQHECPEDANTFWDSGGACYAQPWFWRNGYVYHADSDLLAEIEGCLFSKLTQRNWTCVKQGIREMWADFQENGLGVWGYQADSFVRRFMRILRTRGTRRGYRGSKWSRIRRQWQLFTSFDADTPEGYVR